MPKKTAKEIRKNPDPVDFKSIQWVFNNLDNGQLDEFDMNPLPLLTVMDGVHRLVEMGFKVSIKFDDFSGTGVQITAVCNEPEAENAGLATSARGNDVGDALALLVYKVLIVADGDLRPYVELTRKSRRG